MIISKTSLYVSVSIILVLIMIIHLTIDTANNVNRNTNNVNSNTIIGNSNRELLSTEFQITDGQYVKTYNGIVPLTKCPPGSYRLQGGSNLVLVSGQQNDGCFPCPRGRYGALSGSTNPLCDAPCPTGRYGKRLGMKSLAECEFCPAGTYGDTVGLIRPYAVNASPNQVKDYCKYCPLNSYNPGYGKTSINDCLDCPTGYRGWQCNAPVAINNPNQVA